MAIGRYSASVCAINCVNAALVVFILTHNPVQADYRSQIDMDIDTARSTVASVVRSVVSVRPHAQVTHLFTGEQLVKRLESYRAEAYPDPGSHGAPWTCGYGHTGKDCYPGVRFTKSQATAWFKTDYTKAEADVDLSVTKPLTYYQKIALVSFTYNLGGGNLSRSTLLKDVNAGDYADAAKELKRWVVASGKRCNGLAFRREVESIVFGM